MKPLIRSKGWFRSRILPHIRRGEPLSLASIWILCSSCSFNNSFQDGCLGQVRITMPEAGSKKGAKPRKSKRKITTRAKQVGQSTSPLSTATFSTAKGTAAIHMAPSSQTIKVDWERWNPSTLFPQKQGVDTTQAEPKPLRWSHVQYRSLLPGVLRILFVASKKRPFGVLYPSHNHTMKLKNREGTETWKARPKTVQLCYQSRHKNMGWTHYHIPRNTYAVKKQCQEGHQLGTKQHWFVINDTYAASGVPCRVFFSVGRTKLVVQCGATLYRSSIQNHAKCLQTGLGHHCNAPVATLTKAPEELAILVEK